MNLLYIIGNYAFNKDANTACCEEIIKLQKSNHNIFVVCRGKEDQVIIEDNVEITTIKFKEKQLPNQRVLRFFVKAVKVFSHIFSYPIFNVFYSRKLLKRVKQLVEAKHIDAIVCAINPLENVFPILKIKNTKKILYELDSISDQPVRKDGLYGILYKKRKRFEQSVYENVDFIIQMECHRKHYESSNYDRFRNKIVFSNFPMYGGKNYSEIDFKEIKMIFTGSFLQGIREPLWALDILTKLNIEKRLTIDFFSKGDYEKSFKTIEKQCSYFHANGYVSSSVLNCKLKESNILLSIGNELDSMMPSKIFSYIANCKPIIHFAKHSTDPCIELLFKIPFALIIYYSDDFETSSLKILKFIEELNSLNYDFDDSFLEMNKPLFTYNLLQEILKNENYS